MKNIKLLILTSFVLIFNSCSDVFNPMGEFKEKFILNCLLRSDSTYQIATLTTNYSTGSIDPSSHNIYSFVEGADVRVWFNDSVYLFRDTIITSAGTSNNKLPERFYYSDKFKIFNNEPIEVEVILPGGKRLKSESVTPPNLLFNSTNTSLIQPNSENIFSFTWNNFPIGTMFLPILEFYYEEIENGTIITKSKEIPLKILNGEKIYPQPSNQIGAIFTMEAVRAALNEISINVTNKSNISIHEYLRFHVTAFDIGLSKYVSSTGRNYNDLTARVNELDFTNIDGGYGIFGSYLIAQQPVRFSNNFINSFGYNFIFRN